MARQSGKGPSKGSVKPPEKPPAAQRKSAKDVISRSVEASAARIADLGTAAASSSVAPRQSPPSSAAPLTAADMAAEAVAVITEPAAEFHTSVSAVALGEVVASGPMETAEPMTATAPSEPGPPVPLMTTMAADAAPAGAPPDSADDLVVSEPMAAKPAEADGYAAGTDQLTATVADSPMQAEDVQVPVFTAADALAALNRKTIEAFHTNAAMTVDLVRSLLSAKSVTEAVLIQTEYARHQFEVMSDQARELQALARKMTTDTAAHFNKGFGGSN